MNLVLEPFLIHDPRLTGALKEFTDVKKDVLRKAVDKIANLALVLKTLDGPKEVEAKRYQFLGRYLETSLSHNAGKTDLGKIQAIFIDMCNVKNALQVEALFFGSLLPLFGLYDYISRVPHLRELWETIPVIFSHIQVDFKRPDAYKVSLEPISAWINSLDIAALPESFDLTLLSLLRSFPIDDNYLVIPMHELPAKEILEDLITRADPASKLLAQILYALHFENFLLESASTPRCLTQGIAMIFGGGTFNSYLSKADLIPHFSAMIAKVNALEETGLPSSAILSDKEFINYAGRATASSWLHEASDVYELASTIQLHCRKHFNPKEREILDTYLQSEGCDRYAVTWGENISKGPVHGFERHIPYPISKARHFCDSKESFRLLPFYIFYLNNQMEHQRQLIQRELTVIKKAAALEKKKSKGKPASPKPKPEVHTKAAGGAGLATPHLASSAASGGGGGGSHLDDESSDDEALFAMFARSSPKIAKRLSPTSSPKTSPKPSAISASIASAKTKLSEFTILDRVQAWLHSSERGLEAHGFDSGSAAHVLSREEMIIRHRFPKQILLLVFNPLFSKQMEWVDPRGRTLEHYETFLYIDGSKYMLEATITPARQLYHLYARPIRRMEDFQSLVNVEAEYPVLGEDGGREKHPLTCDEAGITFDEHASALIVFEGKHYKVPRLRAASDLS